MTTAKKFNKAQNLGKSKEPDEDDDEIPTLDESFWSKAEMGSPLRKRLISLRLDNDVIYWFKQQGPSYQPRMNQVLRTFMEFSLREEVRNNLHK